MQLPSTDWPAKIAAWQHSGMSMAAWCRENSESYYRFQYWRKRVAAPVQGRFLELTPPAAPISLECNGVLVHVSKGFDNRLLADILSVLRTD